jgi:hypothetical protein
MKDSARHFCLRVPEALHEDKTESPLALKGTDGRAPKARLHISPVRAPEERMQIQSPALKERFNRLAIGQVWTQSPASTSVSKPS